MRVYKQVKAEQSEGVSGESCLSLRPLGRISLFPSNLDATPPSFSLLTSFVF